MYFRARDKRRVYLHAAHTPLCMRRTQPATCACVYRYRLIGAVVFGNVGSNLCPDGYMRIETESTCQSAAAVERIAYMDKLVSPFFPKGCFVDRQNNRVYFNTHASGAGEPDSRLLCMLGARPARTARLWKRRYKAPVRHLGPLNG